jgi:hypothetical protein
MKVALLSHYSLLTFCFSSATLLSRQRCAPISLVCAETSPLFHAHGATVPGRVEPNTILCPVCRSAAVTQIHLYGLSMEDIERAVELKRANVDKAGPKNGKRSRDVDEGFQDIQAESTYLLASHSHTQSGGLASDNELQRTGRWTDEEIAFVDFILDAFDRGKLSMPQGVKLNEFLGDLLLCKSSRLTKKMKNAKLSVRSYELGSTTNGSPSLDCEMMSTLQDQFLESISNEAAKLELRFHMSKVWRTHFSNLCLQVDCNMLDASEWIASLEDMERRASQAEDKIRKARRRRMGLALKADVRTAPNGVFFAGVAVKRADSSKRVKIEKVQSGFGQTAVGGSSSTLRTITDVSMSTENSVASSEDSSEAEFISSMLEIGTNGKHSRAPSVDFANIFEDLANEGPAMNLTDHPSAYHHVRNNCGPFLEEIVAYMETNDLPFEHVDVWVPSLPPTGQGIPGELRLFHAGHATRSDLDPVMFCQMQEYGEYSVKFSFASGVGLPGRVYATGEPSWECQIDKADPRVFERAGGAKVYGIKTGLGIPLSTTVIGRIVVSMYSTRNIQQDPAMIQKVKADLAMYAPEPKWKLVVDLGESKGPRPRTQSAASLPRSRMDGMVHGEQTRPRCASMNNVGTPVLDFKNHSSAPPVSTSTPLESVPPMDEEQHIATLLGDYMPLSGIPAAYGETSSSSAPDVILSHFVSLRLLLLRSSARRSAEENEMLDVIKNSFSGYSKDKRRSDKELAYLLAKDWQYLVAGMESQKPAALPHEEYQSHVMGPPTVHTYSSKGAPAAMPSSLSYVDPSKVGKPSPGSGITPHLRRISNPDEAEALYININVVDEN